MADKQGILLKTHFREPDFQTFLGEHAPHPQETRAFDARCSRLWRSYKHV